MLFVEAACKVLATGRQRSHEAMPAFAGLLSPILATAAKPLYQAWGSIGQAANLSLNCTIVHALSQGKRDLQGE